MGIFNIIITVENMEAVLVDYLHVKKSNMKRITSLPYTKLYSNVELNLK